VDPVFKAKLKKEETTGLSRLEYLLIASAENELSDIEEKELAELMAADSTLLDELNLFQKTKLPKQEIAFPEKAFLKKKTGVLIHWRPYAAAIASAAAVIWLFFNVNFTDPKYQSKKLNLQTAQSKVEEEPTDFNYVLASELKVEEPKYVAEKEIRPKGKPESSTNQFAELPNKTEELKPDERGDQLKKLEPIQPLPNSELAGKTEEKEPKSIESIIESTELADLKTEIKQESSLISSNKNKAVSIQEYAKQKLKKEVLKNKTFSEALAEELGSITNDKISFENKKDQSGETEQFAINIGKFSFSRKK
jgi:hypothetical protein